MLMINNLHDLFGQLYLTFLFGKHLLNQELMAHTLKLVKQFCFYYPRLMKH